MRRSDAPFRTFQRAARGIRFAAWGWGGAGTPGSVGEYQIDRRGRSSANCPLAEGFHVERWFVHPGGRRMRMRRSGVSCWQPAEDACDGMAGCGYLVSPCECVSRQDPMIDGED